MLIEKYGLLAEDFILVCIKSSEQRWGLYDQTASSILVTWDFDPIENPFENMTDEEIDNLSDDEFEKYSKFFYVCDKMEKVLQSLLTKVWDQIYQSCTNAGYDRQEHGFIECWLTNKMALLIKDYNGKQTGL